jgi:hypothetical protein
VALAQNLQIDSEHEGAAPRRDRALDQRADEAAILHHIELEPERLADRFRHVLDRADRHRAEAKRNAGRVRRAAGQNLPVAVLHATESDRREGDRKLGRLADNGRSELPLRYVDEHPLAQPQALEIVAVGSQRFLRVGAVIGIFEERPGNLAASQLPQVFDAGDVLHRPPPPARYCPFQ